MQVFFFMFLFIFCSSVSVNLIEVLNYVNVMCLVQLLPRVSSLSPVTTSFPLVTVLFLTAIKDAIEDYVYLFYSSESMSVCMMTCKAWMCWVFYWEVELQETVLSKDKNYFLADKAVSKWLLTSLFSYLLGVFIGLGF